LNEDSKGWYKTKREGDNSKGIKNPTEKKILVSWPYVNTKKFSSEKSQGIFYQKKYIKIMIPLNFSSCLYIKLQVTYIWRYFSICIIINYSAFCKPKFVWNKLYISMAIMKLRTCLFHFLMFLLVLYIFDKLLIDPIMIFYGLIYAYLSSYI